MQPLQQLLAHQLIRSWRGEADARGLKLVDELLLNLIVKPYAGDMVRGRHLFLLIILIVGSGRGR
jgi:hypothetical protein